MTSPAPTFSDPAEAARSGQYRAAQIEEYGTYIAAQHIFVGNARAFAPGHPVPKSTAEAMGWHRDGTCVPAGTPLPQTAPDRAAQLRARAEEINREQHAIALELAAAEGGATTGGDDYESKTVVALRDILATRGLPQTGNKAELVARLQDDDAADDEVEE